MNQEPTFPVEINLDIPEALRKVIEKAMAKRPEDRFQTAAEFMKDLKIAVESPALAAQALSAEATKISSSSQSSQKNGIGQSSTIDFNMTDFEERLKESQREADIKSGITDIEEEQDNSLREVNLGFHQFI